MEGCSVKGHGEPPSRVTSTAARASSLRLSVVSVSLATRGQTDMRGLVTAGRGVRQERTACLESSVARDSRAVGLLIAVPRVAPRAAGTTRSTKPGSWAGLFLEHGQRPAPAGQLAGDGH